MKKLVRRLIVALLFGVALYGAIILYRGASSIAASFATYAAWTFAAACGLAFSNYVLRFLKWEYYLAVLGIRGVPKGQSFLIFLSGFVLTITPGKVGEVFKSIILNQLRGVAIARTAPIVVAERLTDLIGVIVMITVGSLGFPGGLVWASAGAALVLGLLLFVPWRPLSRFVLELLPRLPGLLGRVGAKVAPRVEGALVELRVLTSPRRLVLPSLLSIAAWSLEGIALWVILQGFHQVAPLAIDGVLLRDRDARRRARAGTGRPRRDGRPPRGANVEGRPRPAPRRRRRPCSSADSRRSGSPCSSASSRCSCFG